MARPARRRTTLASCDHHRGHNVLHARHLPGIFPSRVSTTVCRELKGVAMNEVPAVVSAVRLLERIAADWPDPVASGTLIDELGLNRSTCYNILGTLQRIG